MKIELEGEKSSAGSVSPLSATLPEAGYTLAQVLVAAATIGFLAGLLYGVVGPGLGIIRCAGQNLRATQILMQRAESLRLFTAREVCDPSKYHQPLFVAPHDPGLGTSQQDGVQYAGYVSADGLSSTQNIHMRPVTLTLYWTNYCGTKPIVHMRQVPTRLARNGMPKYIWGTL